MATRTALLVFGINPARIGGIETHTREVAARLGAAGWQAVLAFHNHPPEPVREYLALPNVKFDILPNAWINSLATMRGFSALLTRHRPRLVHLQFTPFISLFPWIARLHGAWSVIFTDHASRRENYATRPAPFLKRVAGRILNHPLTMAVSVSEFNRRSLIAPGLVHPERVVRIYNGADLRRAAAADPSAGAAFRARYGIPAGRVLVTQVSSIIPEKGIPDVLEAARIALTEERNLHFAFVGEGKSRAAYEAQASSIGISAHVTWTGLVQDPMGDGAFLAADVVCQASRWQEAFGLVIAEAMAFGKPVVAARTGGIPEIVNDGETGVLVDRGDVAALARAFVSLARQPELRQRLGSAGRLRAEAEFDVRKSAAQLVSIYGLDR
jgi:glycosyltransferase involved in cell wall biosynthesis